MPAWIVLFVAATFPVVAAAAEPDYDKGKLNTTVCGRFVIKSDI